MNYRLFHFGSINIYSYGVMVAIGFVLGILLASNRAKKLGENPQNMLDLCLYIMISALVGARVFYVVGQWSYYMKNPIEIFYLQRGGLVFFGGLVLAGITTFLFLRIKKLNIWKYFDILAPSLAVGHAFGRIGCFLNGCCYGKICAEGFWSHFSVRFPKVVELTRGLNNSFYEQIIGSPPFVDHLNRGLVTANDNFSYPVYPTQLISAGMNFIFFFILLYAFKKRKFDGQIWWLYIIIYTVGRFLVEFIRAYNHQFKILGMTFSQNVAIIIFALGIYMYFRLRKKTGIIQT